MNDPWLEILHQNHLAGSGLSFILVAGAYIIVKTTLWWVLFGTGKLLFGKYGLHEWLFRTLAGLAGFAGIILLGLYLLYMFNPESTFWWGVWGVALLCSFRIWLREILSLFGLLRGDWNPFNPELRFIAWHETYIFSLFGNKGCSGRWDDFERENWKRYIHNWNYDSIVNAK